MLKRGAPRALLVQPFRLCSVLPIEGLLLGAVPYSWTPPPDGAATMADRLAAPLCLGYLNEPRLDGGRLGPPPCVCERTYGNSCIF